MNRPGVFVYCCMFIIILKRRPGNRTTIIGSKNIRLDPKVSSFAFPPDSGVSGGGSVGGGSVGGGLVGGGSVGGGLVGGTSVAVGGADVAVGGTGVNVGGADVNVGGMDVDVFVGGRGEEVFVTTTMGVVVGGIFVAVFVGRFVGVGIGLFGSD
ncbi:MAG: hypothetical protein DCC56_12790 [Anaerolineae bacterium]|nr:MAG: hypothetical protein DCC56_12790 [Anaerolineae bacterium]